MNPILLKRNFELIDEKEYTTKRTDIDNLLDSIEKDPYDLESNSTLKDKEMDTFQKAQEKIGINMAVVLFMEGALKFFEGMPKEKIKEIAIDIAVQGTQRQTGRSRRSTPPKPTCNKRSN